MFYVTLERRFTEDRDRTQFEPTAMSSEPQEEFHRIAKLPPYVFAVMNEMKAKARAAHLRHGKSGWRHAAPRRQ